MKTSAQLRAARAMLRIEQTELAERAGVSVETIKRLEALPDELRAQFDTLDNVQVALEMSGIEFIDEEIIGVRLRKDRNAAFITEVVNRASEALAVALHTEFGSDPAAIADGRERAIERAIDVTTRILRQRLDGFIPGPRQQRKPDKRPKNRN